MSSEFELRMYAVFMEEVTDTISRGYINMIRAAFWNENSLSPVS